ncbi:MAG: hypothetical protein PWQ12_1376 [Clostridiales bacterium]|jgi:hypothetical protein|nr:hypothetical protein [Clostridiales bacterium]
MIYYICIDDTDTLDSKGTGEIAEELSIALESIGCGIPSAVSRHQLYFHPDIPYTSHNSSMCFELKNSDVTLETLIDFCGSYLKTQSAVGSDPGLCILSADQLNNPDREALIQFGYRAKKEVLTKESAYDLAKRYNIHLSEHGGTGQGIIGALAGVGLRMDGNDGRYKGKIFLGENCDNMLAKDILSHPQIDCIRSSDGEPVEADAVIFVSDRIKTVRVDGQSTLIVQKISKEGAWYWKCVDKEGLKKY